MNNASIQDNLMTAESIANELVYNGKTVIDTTQRYGDQMSDLIWGYVDGLQRKFVTDRLKGRVSLRERIDWDIDRSNRQFLADIDTMKGLLK